MMIRHLFVLPSNFDPMASIGKVSLPSNERNVFSLLVGRSIENLANFL